MLFLDAPVRFSTGEDTSAFTGLTEREAELAEKLNTLMDHEQLWRPTGLSIKDLASQVGVANMFYAASSIRASDSPTSLDICKPSD